MIYAKIAGIALAVALLFGGGWYTGSLRGSSALAQAQARAANAETLATAQALSKEQAYEIQVQRALDEYIKPVLAPIVLTPVWVYRAPTLRTGALPGAPDPASVHPGLGGPVAGDRAVNIRADVDAFKARWEEVISQCRLLRDSWPP